MDAETSRMIAEWVLGIVATLLTAAIIGSFIYIFKSIAEIRTQSENNKSRLEAHAQTLVTLAALPTQVASFTGTIESDVKWIKENLAVMQAYLLRQQPSIPLKGPNP